MKKIFVIILHFGEIEITKECIASLGKSEKYPYTLVVVNNTQKILQAKDFFVKNCVVINNKENKGFSGGVNKGISYALSKDADAILLLNNDTRVQRPILPSLVALLFSGEGIGIIGPAIKFVKKRKKVFDIGGSMTWFGKTYHTEIASQKNIYPHEVRYITGAAMLIKKEVFEKIGLFDKRFFLYYEDVDFCLRARERGFSTWVDTEVSIYHLLSKTAGKASPLSVYHQTRSAVLFGKKYMGNIFQKGGHFIFMVAQSLLFTIKQPKSGLTAWKTLSTTSEIFQTSLFILIIIFATLASFWRIFSFTFWKDDWSLLWSTLYNLKGYHGYFNHPGTPIEFFFLTPFFKTNPFYWMLFGYLLRVINAFLVGLFAKKLTHSKIIGFLSGIFFAASYTGGESLHFVSAQVTALALVPLCMTGVYFIKVVEEQKRYIYAFLFWLFVAFLIDPPRTVPIIFLLPLTLILEKNGEYYKYVIKILKRFYVAFLLLGVPLFITWFIFLSPGTLLGKLFVQVTYNPTIFFQKLYELHHFAATIGNLFIGWLYRAGQDDQNIGIYSKLFALAGYSIGLLGIGSLFAFFKTKRTFFGIMAFTIFWTFLFYLPNFLSEPRAPMAAPHRYLLIPSVGFILFIAYLIAQLKQKLLAIVFSLLFIACNIYQSNIVLSHQATYRSTHVVTKIWNNLLQSIPKKQEYNSILMVSGKEPWVSEDVLLSGAAPLALQRKLTDNDKFPMMTNDFATAAEFLCHDNLPQINRWNIVPQKKRIHISHIYAWTIEDNGKVTNISSQRREELEIFTKKLNCTPVQ